MPILEPEYSIKAEDRSWGEGILRAEILTQLEDLPEGRQVMAPRGTAVIAAAPGKVEKLFKSDAGGNTIYVRSEDRRTIYYYAHLDRYAAGLTEGQTVNRGQPIGFVGSTGDANPVAPHLHFEVVRTSPETKWWEPGTPINPYVLLGGRV